MSQDAGAVLLIGEDTQSSSLIQSQLDSRGVVWQQRTESPFYRSADIDAVSMAFIIEAAQSATLDLVIRLSEAVVPTVVVTSYQDDSYAIACFKAGALDVLAAPLLREFIDEALDRAMRLRRLEYQNSAMRKYARQLATLTARERNLIQMAAEGSPNKQIARAVGLSIKSVERIRRGAYAKLQVRSTAEMTRVYILGSLFQDAHDLATPSEENEHELA